MSRPRDVGVREDDSEPPAIGLLWWRFPADYWDDTGPSSHGPLATALWCRLISWSCRQLSDGRISALRLRTEAMHVALSFDASVQATVSSAGCTRPVKATLEGLLRHGVIPDVAADWSWPSETALALARTAIEELRTSGFLGSERGGYRLRKYAQHQQTAIEVCRGRRAAARRQRRRREKLASMMPPRSWS